MENRAAIEIIGEKRCVGCYGCLAVCNHSALTMAIDLKGFLKATLNSDLCVKCGLCTDKCPVLSPPSRKVDADFKSEVYGAWAEDEAVREKSSSGGIFTELASAFMDIGGKVAGAVWEDGVVKHKIISDKSDLSLLRGSKYLQSREMDSIYRQIKKMVLKKQAVLFVGLPCQVSALKNIVDSDYLLTVDLVCLGVPSYRVYQKHLQETYPNHEVDKVDFRNKANGWTDFSLRYYTAEGQTVDTVSHNSDLFYRFFNSKLIISEACTHCQFNEAPRKGDITLGDYWGVEKQYFSQSGVSIVMSNTRKGDRWIAQLQEVGKVSFFPTTLSHVSKGTWRINSNKLSVSARKRDRLYGELDQKALKELAGKYLRVSWTTRLGWKIKSLRNKWGM